MNTCLAMPGIVLRRLTAGLLALSIACTSHAGLVGQSASADRQRLAAYLDREEVARELARLGVTREEAKSRAAALGDAEAASLARRVSELPAGSATDPVSGAAMIIFTVVMLAILAVQGTVVLVKYMVRTGDAAREQ